MKRLINNETTVHGMVDIETLGTNSKAPIIQIGIALFTLKGIHKTWKMNIDFKDSVEHAIADGATIKWWLEQSKEAQASVCEQGKSVAQTCKQIDHFISSHPIDCFWSHATFDFPVIKSMFESIGEIYPIPYNTSFDLRTLEFLGGDILWEERKDVHHDALADAIYQAKHAIKLLKTIPSKPDITVHYLKH